MLLFAAALTAVSVSCGDDTTTPGGGNAGGQGGNGDGGQDPNGGGGQGTGGQPIGGAPQGGNGQGGSGGGLADNGAPSSELVSAGDVASNATYRMVFTMGQPTQNQQVSTSPDHRLIGGFVGATGSP